MFAGASSGPKVVQGFAGFHVCLPLILQISRTASGRWPALLDFASWFPSVSLAGESGGTLVIYFAEGNRSGVPGLRRIGAGDPRVSVHVSSGGV